MICLKPNYRLQDLHLQEVLQFVDQLLGMLFTRRCIVDDDVKNIFYNDDIYDGVSVYSLWPDEGA